MAAFPLQHPLEQCENKENIAKKKKCPWVNQKFKGGQKGKGRHSCPVTRVMPVLSMLPKALPSR